MVTDQIADLLTRIRNAQSVGHPTVGMPASKTKVRILEVLKQEGYIEEFERTDEGDGKASLKVVLKYSVRGEPVIKQITRLSSPGCRKYIRKGDIGLYKHGLGTVIISTSKGMLSDRDARLQGVGGELVCSVF
jgi:small subunit ribosomal protein S8